MLEICSACFARVLESQIQHAGSEETLKTGNGQKIKRELAKEREAATVQAVPTRTRVARTSPGDDACHPCDDTPAQRRIRTTLYRSVVQPTTSLLLSSREHRHRGDWLFRIRDVVMEADQSKQEIFN